MIHNHANQYMFKMEIGCEEHNLFYRKIIDQETIKNGPADLILWHYEGMKSKLEKECASKGKEPDHDRS